MVKELKRTCTKRKFQSYLSDMLLKSWHTLSSMLDCMIRELEERESNAILLASSVVTFSLVV